MNTQFMKQGTWPYYFCSGIKARYSDLVENLATMFRLQANQQIRLD